MDSANLHLHHLQHQVHLNDAASAASSSSYENPTTFSRIGEFSDCGGILSTPFLNTSMSQVMELQDGSLNMERAPISMIEDSHHHHHRDLLSMSHNMMRNINLHPSLLSSVHPDDLRDLSHNLMLRTFMSSSTTSSFPSLSLTDHHSNGKLSSSCQIHPSVNISEGSESPSRGFPRSSGYINRGVSLDHSMQKSDKAARRPTELMPSRQGSTKKTRLNTHLCPSLQIRKQKLGDRIASLQQLVAPYGKTDTTSVLTEAIGCIKYLQDQVQALSVPYMRRPPSSRSGASARTQGGHQVEKEDLRSRGLCLVPLVYVLPCECRKLWRTRLAAIPDRNLIP